MKKLKLENKNFRVNSSGWKKITIDKEKYLVNPKKDIWEITKGEYKGEQLFTYDAAMRETKKVGKRMPTDEEFNALQKEDIPNIAYVGDRNIDNSFLGQNTYTSLWSSTKSGTGAWRRDVYSDYPTTIYRNTNNRAYGFSVRCVSK